MTKSPNKWVYQQAHYVAWGSKRNKSEGYILKLPQIVVPLGIMELPNCCGIGVVYNWNGNGRGAKKLTIALARNLIRVINDQLRSPHMYKLYFTTITDEQWQSKRIQQALVECGWVAGPTTKSDHGDYLIHTFHYKVPE